MFIVLLLAQPRLVKQAGFKPAQSNSPIRIKIIRLLADMQFCTLTKCICCSAELEPKPGGFRDHEATVWNDSVWEYVKHGTKVCSNNKCRTMYKLNYARCYNMRLNILTKDNVTDQTIFLLHPGLGFRWCYLRQLWHRTCRSAQAAGAEAAAILLTYLDWKPQYEAKGKS